MTDFLNFIRKKPSLITFITIVIGFSIGIYVSIEILLLLFTISIVIYIVTRRSILLLFVLLFSASIYKSSRKPIKFRRLFFSGVYLENRIIDPVYGELSINLHIEPASIVYGSARYIEWGSQKRLTEVRIKGNHPTILNRIFNYRDMLDNKIDESIGGDIGKICSAIILGKRGDLPPYIYKRFQYCGAAHLLAVSGLHTGIVFMIILIFLRVIQIKRKPALIISGLLVSLYALLTGLRLPVLRASIMLWFFIIGEVKERNIDPLNTLSASGILILIFMPSSIHSISFQLSFIAVFSILIILKVFESRLRQISNNWLKKWIIIPLFVTLSAQLGTFPLVAYYFGYIPLFGLIANLILIPLVGTLIAGTFLLWTIPILQDSIGSFVWGTVYLMNKIMIILERLPYSVIEVQERDPRILFSYLFLVIIFIGIMMFRKKGTVIPVTVPS